MSQKRNYKVTWAEFFIVIVNKGLLIPAFLMICFLILLWRLPSKNILVFLQKIISGLENTYLLGYAFFFLTLIGWYTHARLMRKRFSKEFKRIGKEKSKIQSQNSKIKFQSSDN